MLLQILMQLRRAKMLRVGRFSASQHPFTMNPFSGRSGLTRTMVGIGTLDSAPTARSERLMPLYGFARQAEEYKSYNHDP